MMLKNPYYIGEKGLSKLVVSLYKHQCVVLWPPNEFKGFPQRHGFAIRLCSRTT